MAHFLRKTFPLYYIKKSQNWATSRYRGQGNKHPMTQTTLKHGRRAQAGAVRATHTKAQAKAKSNTTLGLSINFFRWPTICEKLVSYNISKNHEKAPHLVVTDRNNSIGLHLLYVSLLEGFCLKLLDAPSGCAVSPSRKSYIRPSNTN